MNIFKTPRSFFSFDSFDLVRNQRKEMKTILKTFSSTIKSRKEGGHPVTSKAEALTHWGLAETQGKELEKTAKKISAQGFAFLALWFVIALLAAYSYTKGNLSVMVSIEYGLILAACGSLALVKMWQGEVLSNSNFISFSSYCMKFKWIFSILLFFCYATVFQNTVAMAGAVDLPDFDVKLATDLSSRFMGLVIGEPWSEHGGTAVSSGVSSVLIPILTALNTGALSFVTIFTVYIFSFGIVHVANSGNWGDSQIFSTFWSPIRTVAAIALCSPLPSGISFLQHIVLVAIAMSINLANNATTLLIDKVNDTAGVTLSASMGPAVEDNFGKILSATQTAMTIQYASIGIFGINLTSNDSFKVSQTKGNSLSGYTTTITFTPPSRVDAGSMPTITIKTPSQEIANGYVSAISALVNKLTPGFSTYLSSDVSKRGSGLDGIVAEGHKAFSETLSQAFQAAIAAQDTSDATQILKNATDASGTYGWMTVGLYPFIIARQQGMAQGMVKASIETSNGDFADALGHIASVQTAEVSLVTTLQTQLSTQITTLENSGMYAGMTSVGHTRTGGTGAMYLFDKAADMIDSTFPAIIVSKLKESNPISAMFSFGSTLVDTSAALITVWGAISGGADGVAKSGNTAGILGVIPGLGAAAEKALGGASGALAGSVTVWTPIILLLLGTTFIFGTMCCYVLPVIPVIFWCRALVSWAVMTLETLMGACFWAAAHVLPEGIGLAGQHARNGYLMLLDVFIRPVLLVCGAIISMLVVQVWGAVLADILGLWAAMTNQAAGYWLIGVIFTSGVMIFVTYESMKWLYIQGIGVFPEKVIRWCGGQASETGVQGSVEQTQAFSNKVAGYATGGGGNVVKNVVVQGKEISQKKSLNK